MIYNGEMCWGGGGWSGVGRGGGFKRGRGQGEEDRAGDNLWKETKPSLIEVYGSFVLLSSIGFTCKGYLIRR